VICILETVDNFYIDISGWQSIGVCFKDYVNKRSDICQMKIKYFTKMVV